VARRHGAFGREGSGQALRMRHHPNLRAFGGTIRRASEATDSRRR